MNNKASTGITTIVCQGELRAQEEKWRAQADSLMADLKSNSRLLLFQLCSNMKNSPSAMVEVSLIRRTLLS